jgi:hypothetical protein
VPGGRPLQQASLDALGSAAILLLPQGSEFIAGQIAERSDLSFQFGISLHGGA